MDVNKSFIDEKLLHTLIERTENPTSEKNRRCP
jgi:hypothetical protein